MKKITSKIVFIVLILIYFSPKSYGQQFKEQLTIGMGKINCIAYSPDGKKIVTAGSGRLIFIWDLENEQIIDTIKIDYKVLSASYSPDGKKLAFGCMGGISFIYNTADNSLYAKLRIQNNWEDIVSTIFSPDGKKLICGRSYKYINIWDVENIKVLRTIDIDNNIITSLSMSPDGTKLLTLIRNSKINIWDINTGSLLKSFETKNTHIFSAIFYSNDKKFVSCDNQIRIWDYESGIITDSIISPSPVIEKIAVSEDGAKIAGSRWNGSVYVWDFNTKALINKREEANYRLLHLSFTNDDSSIISVGDNEQLVKIWNIKKGLCEKKLTGHNFLFDFLAFHPDNKSIISISDRKAIKIWDILNGNLIKTIEDSNYNITSVYLLNEGRKAVGQCSDSMIRFWDINTGNLTKSVKCNSEIHKFKISPDESVLVYIGHILSPKFIDMNTGIELNKLTDVQAYDFAFSPDGEKFLYYGYNKNIGEGLFLYDFKTDTAYTLTTSINNICGLIFSPDSKKLAIGGSWEIYLWDLINNKQIYELGCCQTPFVTAFSPDGKSLINAGGYSGYVYGAQRMELWDVESGNRKDDIIGHFDCINSLKYNLDGSLFASGGSDGKIIIWEVPKPNYIEFEHITLKNSNNIQIFPNPSGSEINISLPGNISNITKVEVIDITGRQVFIKEKTNDAQSNIQIDISNLPIGYYLVKVLSGNGVYAGYFIKE